MKEVKAYQTVDGKLFIDKKEATEHEKGGKVTVKRDTIFKEKRNWIQNYVDANFDDDDFRGDKPKVDDISIYHEGDFAWDCENEDNPIDKCIYSYDLYMGDDCCVFCGQPEERK